MRRLRRVSLVLLIALSGLSCAQAFPTEATVRRAIDGDTIELVNGELVRYIGIDTPEARRRARPTDSAWRAGHPQQWIVDPEPMAEEATAFNRQLVEGKQVRLEYDVQPHDRFGRLLAYVYVGSTMVNAELVCAGFAQLLTIPPNVRYVERFRACAEEARRAHRGLWEVRGGFEGRVSGRRLPERIQETGGTAVTGAD